MSGERESLWGVQRRRAAAPVEDTHDDGASPKAQKVLDLQRQAGNAAVAGAVQRSIWGDDDSWLGGVGTMFPASSGGPTSGGPETSKAPGGIEPMRTGFWPDTSKVVNEGPHAGPGAGLDGGAGAFGGAKGEAKGYEQDQVGPEAAAAKGYGENEVGEDDAAAKGVWDDGFDTSGNEYKDPVGPTYDDDAGGGGGGGEAQYAEEYK